MFLFECSLEFPYTPRKKSERVYVIAESPGDAELLITSGGYKSIHIKRLCDKKNIVSSDPIQQTIETLGPVEKLPSEEDFVELKKRLSPKDWEQGAPAYIASIAYREFCNLKLEQ